MDVPEAFPSILDYARPVDSEPQVGLPTVFYPGPPHVAVARSGPQSLVLAAVVLLAVVLICACWRGGHLKRRFASSPKGLAARGWTVYYLQGCGYCDKQAALLGSFARYVKYGPGGVLLGGYTEAPPLTFGAIRGFPHWYNTRTGETRGGFQDAAALAEMAA